MKGRSIPYSAEELTWIKRRRAWTRAALHRGFCATFGREDVSLSNLHALCKRKGWKTGRTGNFEKGQDPWNKGSYCPKGSEKGWFRPGIRQGKASTNYKPIGSERIVDGYRERKMHDGMPFRSRWKMVHVLGWEQVNGSVPDGHCLKCVDGNRLNTDPSNWECIPRALLPRLAGGNRYRPVLAYDAAPEQLKPIILNTAKLAHAVKMARDA